MDPVALIIIILLALLWHPIILLTGAVLGSWRGGLAILVCLAEGAVAHQFLVSGSLIYYLSSAEGLRFFGGYILSWLLAAYLTGLLYKRCLYRRFRTSFLAMLPGSALIFVLTVSWLLILNLVLYHTLGIGLGTLLFLLLLLAVQTVVPSLVAAIVLTKLWKMPRLRQYTLV